MLPDQDTWNALTAIRSLLGRVSTTARSPNFEALVDVVNLALWDPERRHSGARVWSLQERAEKRRRNMTRQDCGWYN